MTCNYCGLELGKYPHSWAQCSITKPRKMDTKYNLPPDDPEPGTYQLSDNIHVFIDLVEHMGTTRKRWYYYYRTEDESVCGPFSTLQECEKAFEQYCAFQIEGYPLCYCCGGKGCMACNDKGYMPIQRKAN